MKALPTPADRSGSPAGHEHRRRPRRRGFTLLELLVSFVVVAIILTSIATLTSVASRAWKTSTNKIEAFRSARVAFEGMTRRLSQATLNTYWDYHPPQVTAADPPPTRYVRQSELQFVSGKNLIAGQITHAIFFQAPEGRVDDIGACGGLEDLLNACGYFIQFGPDPSAPAFMSEVLKPRYRYRLMEYVEASESLRIYDTTAEDADYNRWFTQPSNPPVGRVLAENIITMVVEPRLARGDQVSGSQLAPGFEYDSRANAMDSPQPRTAHQIPPVVHVTLVALDETSAQRLQKESGSSEPNLGFSYDQVLKKNEATADGSQLEIDLRTIEEALTARKLTYRVFRTDIMLRGAKWSDENP